MPDLSAAISILLKPVLTGYNALTDVTFNHVSRSYAVGQSATESSDEVLQGTVLRLSNAERVEFRQIVEGKTIVLDVVKIMFVDCPTLVNYVEGDRFTFTDKLGKTRQYTVKRIEPNTVLTNVVLVYGIAS
jgi:hypothetical protein